MFVFIFKLGGEKTESSQEIIQIQIATSNHSINVDSWTTFGINFCEWQIFMQAIHVLYGNV